MEDGLNEVEDPEGDEYQEADEGTDNDLAPGEFFPIGLELIDELGDGEACRHNEDEDHESFPVDAIKGGLAGVGLEEGRFCVAGDGPNDEREPEGGEDADQMHDHGQAAFVLGDFRIVVDGGGSHLHLPC